MPRRSKEDAGKTRQLLLDTALKLFAERGIARTNLKDIAIEAALTHGALYWHFKNKADLLSALYDECRLELSDIFIDQLQSARQNALASLGGFIYEWSIKVVQDERSANIWRVFHQGVNHEPELKVLAPHIKQEHEEWLGLLSRLIKKARKQGLLCTKAVEKDTLSVAAIGVVMGVSKSVMTLDAELVDVKKLAQQMTSAFINGVKA